MLSPAAPHLQVADQPEETNTTFIYLLSARTFLDTFCSVGSRKELVVVLMSRIRSIFVCFSRCFFLFLAIAAAQPVRHGRKEGGVAG